MNPQVGPRLALRLLCALVLLANCACSPTFLTEEDCAFAQNLGRLFTFFVEKPIDQVAVFVPLLKRIDLELQKFINHVLMMLPREPLPRSLEQAHARLVQALQNRLDAEDQLPKTIDELQGEFNIILARFSAPQGMPNSGLQTREQADHSGPLHLQARLWLLALVVLPPHWIMEELSTRTAQWEDQLAVHIWQVMLGGISIRVNFLRSILGGSMTLHFPKSLHSACLRLINVKIWLGGHCTLSRHAAFVQLQRQGQLAPAHVQQYEETVRGFFAEFSRFHTRMLEQLLKITPETPQSTVRALKCLLESVGYFDGVPCTFEGCVSALIPGSRLPAYYMIAKSLLPMHLVALSQAELGPMFDIFLLRTETCRLLDGPARMEEVRQLLSAPLEHPWDLSPYQELLRRNRAASGLQELKSSLFPQFMQNFERFYGLVGPLIVFFRCCSPLADGVLQNMRKKHSGLLEEFADHCLAQVTRLACRLLEWVLGVARTDQDHLLWALEVYSRCVHPLSQIYLLNRYLQLRFGNQRPDKGLELGQSLPAFPFLWMAFPDYKINNLATFSAYAGSLEGAADLSLLRQEDRAWLHQLLEEFFAPSSAFQPLVIDPTWEPEGGESQMYASD